MVVHDVQRDPVGTNITISNSVYQRCVTGHRRSSTMWQICKICIEAGKMRTLSTRIFRTERASEREKERQIKMTNQNEINWILGDQGDRIMIDIRNMKKT